MIILQQYRLSSDPDSYKRYSRTINALGASVFAGRTNFQTEMAVDRGLPYADYFLAYTICVMVCRVVLTLLPLERFEAFKGQRGGYRVIAILQYIMAASVVLFSLRFLVVVLLCS